MRASPARIAFLAFALYASAAFPNELDDFNAAAEKALAHNRVALGYLRTGNSDLATLEINRMRAAWSALTGRFGKPPDAFAANRELYTATLVEVDTQLVAASIMVGSGRPDAASAALNAVRAALGKLRRANGIVVLADCIADANAAMDPLMAYDRAIDWSKPAARLDLAGKAATYGNAIAQCDAMASETLRTSPEFRRLIDGAKAGLALIPRAIETRDGDLLHRVLIELRSYDNLLAFRFG